MDSAGRIKGCPIRKFPDQSVLPAPRDLSQVTTSFIASVCQGIHREPFVAWPINLSNAYRRWKQILMLSSSTFASDKNKIKLWFARHESKNAQESRLLLKRIFIVLDFISLSEDKIQNNASVRCFVLSRLTYAVVKVLPDFKSNHQLLDHLIRAQHLINQFTRQLKSTCSFGMTGSWGHPADTSKSHNNRAQLHHLERG